MYRQSLIKKVVCLLFGFAALVSATLGTNADENNLDLSVTLERQALANSELDLSIAWPIEIDQKQTSVLSLPKPRSPLVSFIKDCAELDAIPLIEISRQKDKRMFFGIDFEGYLGIHARL